MKRLVCFDQRQIVLGRKCYHAGGNGLATLRGDDAKRQAGQLHHFFDHVGIRDDPVALNNKACSMRHGEKLIAILSQNHHPHDPARRCGNVRRVRTRRGGQGDKPDQERKTGGDMMDKAREHVRLHAII